MTLRGAGLFPSMSLGIVLAIMVATAHAGAQSISSAEHQSRVADLRTMIDDLSNNRRVFLTLTDKPVVVTNQRLHEIASWLERKGGLTALQVPGWIDEQIRKSRALIPSLTEELDGLARQPPASDGGGTKVEWPVPMDWRKLKATMHFTQRTVCQSRTGSPVLLEEVSLELLGDASVDLVFSDGSRIPGAMIPQGSAGGQGRMAFPVQGVSGVFRWQITFNRMNDELVLSNYIVTFVPDETGLVCDPTRLTPQQDPEDDQFPSPMNWLGTKGAVHGDFSINCSDGTVLKGTFKIDLDGNGNIQAAFDQESPEDQVLARSWIQERDDGGYAELSAPGMFGRYVWNVTLRREGNRIALPPSADLRVLPNDSGVECFVPILRNVQ